MKIWNSGALTPPAGADAPAPRAARPSRALRALLRSSAGYALALVWVVAGALLYAAEIVRLLATLD